MPQIRPFDFSRIKKISPRQLRIQQALAQLYPSLANGQALAQSVMQVFERDLGFSFQLKGHGFEEINYNDFFGYLSSPCSAVLFEDMDSGHKIVLDIDYSLVRLLIQRVLGVPPDSSPSVKPLSPIEEGILEFLIVKVLSQIQKMGSVLGSSSLRVLKIAQQPRLLQEVYPPDEPGSVFKFYLGIPGGGGYLRFYFPHPFVEGVILSEDKMISGSEEDIEAGMGRVSHIKASVWSEIGKVILMASEKDQLEEGDVILFDETMLGMSPQGVNGKALLRVGEIPNGGLLTEVIDTEGKMVVKILDFYGGE